jgi:hypothetical protein
MGDHDAGESDMAGHDAGTASISTTTDKGGMARRWSMGNVLSVLSEERKISHRHHSNRNPWRDETGHGSGLDWTHDHWCKYEV